MAKHKFNKAFGRLLREIVKLFKTLTGQFMRWFLRTFLVAGRRGQRQAGFVLPTIAFMLMVLALVVGAIMFRTFNRTSQVISERQQQAIVNAAAPAIDRAKSKLEYLMFPQDSRIPSGIPSEEDLEKLMEDSSRYDLPGETRVQIDIDGNGSPDTANAWKFETDTNGDNKLDAVTVYAIVSRAERQVGGTTYTINPANTAATFLKNDADKADRFLVRNGPLAVQAKSTDPSCKVSGGETVPGWFEPLGSANVFKAFQVYAVTVPKTGANSAITTLQYQQDRAFERANKWGAWFRYDWELYSGDGFNWNGAIHSEGNIFISTGNNGPVRNFLISDPDSCFFNPKGNSEVSAKLQFVQGRIRDNDFGKGSRDITIDLYDPEDLPTQNSKPFVNVTNENDSITGAPSGSGKEAIDISVDPLTLLTRNIAKARTPENPSSNNTWQQDPAWLNDPDNRPLAQKRVDIDKPQCAPYVDDTYRADNRFGPKLSYTKEIFDEKTRQCQASPTGEMGEDIPAANTDLTLDNPPDTEPEKAGLDGYWERRARNEGLRVIVGQRLELGNSFGWVEATEPLYPPAGADGVHQGLGTARRNEGRQYRTLRDNLAAVQATAIYHHTFPSAANDKGFYPITYLATTVHPGTQKTIENSTTFEQPETAFDIPTGSSVFTGNKFGNDPQEILIDFFYGHGTNGWEFEPLAQADFATSIAANQPLGRALRNLANFAGDPDGAFPPKQETAGTQIHPDPTLTMWGNFSNLRDALNRNYAAMSMAEKSTVHTAAGTLGMLAYNISYLEKYTSSNDETALGQAIGSLSLGSDPSPDEVISKLEVQGDKKLFQLARILHLKEQVKRDQLRGFNPVVAGDCTLTGNLAKLCPKLPKFPSLFYLFPTEPRAHSEGGPASNPYVASTINGSTKIYQTVAPSVIALKPRIPVAGANGWKLPYTSTATQRANPINTPLGERYISFLDKAMFDGREMMNVRILDIDLDLLRNTNTSTGGTADTWLPTSGLVYAFREDAVREDAIARPRLSAWGTANSGYRGVWNASKGDPAETNRMDVFGTGAAPTNNPVDPPVCYIAAGTNLITNDPNNPNPPNYEPCTDPPPGNTQARGISPKPVDYYADPDRRPYGFRLKNGADLTRGAGLALTNERNRRGLTFVSDNPVYIQGDFNLHSSNGTTTDRHELTPALANDYSNFYNRSKPASNPFAQFGQDRWRTTEVIADAVNILSNNFCDGTIESGIRGDRTLGGCNANANQRSSYQNSHMWNETAASIAALDWVCENPFDPQKIQTSPGKGCNGPIRVSQQGDVLINSTPPAPYDRYRDFGSNTRQLTTATPTRVNAIIVSGIVPSRKNQGNGGFHNFPRLNEYWGGVNLFMSGSMIQLNYSNYATGPYDQDAWEPTQAPRSGGGSSGEFVNFYIETPGKSRSAPSRVWGYDVGLQFHPAGPAAKRMVTSANTRSEFYREPPADDPYICKLRQATNSPCS